MLLHFIEDALDLTVKPILVDSLAVNYIRIAFDSDLDFLDIVVQVLFATSASSFLCERENNCLH